MPRGGWVGKENTFSNSSASGVWTIEDVMFGRRSQRWPGGNVKVEVGSFQITNGTGNQDIPVTTDLTSAPVGSWAVIFWAAGPGAASGTWSANIMASLGFAANGGGAISQYAVATAHWDAQATSSAKRRMAAKVYICQVVNNSALQYIEAEMGAVPFPSATSMRINKTTNTDQQTPIVNYMIISGLTGAKVINDSFPASTGNKSVTGVGFSPDLVFTLLPGMSGSMPGAADGSLIGFGAMNKHGQQWANAFYSQNGQAGANTSRWQQTDACLLSLNINETPLVQGHYVSMDPDGFTVNLSTTNSGDRLIALCLDGVSSKIGAFTKTTSVAPAAQTVDSRQGFTPKMALFSGVSEAPGAAPRAHAMWSLSATDTVNERAAALLDRDAAATTEADSVWRSDKATVIPDGFPPNQNNLADWSTADGDSFTLSWTASSAYAYEVLYLIIGDPGTDTFPATVNADGLDSLAHATATAYSNQKKGVELSDGSLVTVTTTSTPAAQFRRSVGGQTWTYYVGAGILGWSNGSIDAYVDSGGTERLVAMWKQSGTGGGRTDTHKYLMVGTFSSDRLTLTWGTAISLYAADSGIDYPDIVCHAEGTGGYAHVVTSQNTSAPINYANYCPVSINSSGVPTKGVAIDLNTSYGVNIATFPSIDYDPATKRLFVAWSAGTTGSGRGIRFRTAAYSSGSWVWASELEVDIAHYINSDSRYLKVRWDGIRVIIGGLLRTAEPADDHMQYETSDFAAFTSRTLDTNVATTTKATYFGDFIADAGTGDTYFIGWSGEALRRLHYRKWTRSTTTMGDPVLVDNGGGLSGSAGYANAFPVTSGIGWVYTAGNNSPYAVKYDRLQLG